jgi:hypothetical protein
MNLAEDNKLTRRTATACGMEADWLENGNTLETHDVLIEPQSDRKTDPSDISEINWLIKINFFFISRN